MFDRRQFLSSAPLLVSAVAALAEAWPQKPVRIVFPYAAGSSGDVLARLFAQRLGEVFGRPFVVENRTGANGVVGAEAVARAPADGHTLLWAITPQLAIAPAMSKVPYDPVEDFAPISAVCANTFALVVNSMLPVKTVTEFVDYIRSQQNTLSYAEGGIGSIGHLAMALFLMRSNLNMTNVTYRGNQPALNDVAAGHVPVMFSLLGDAISQSGNGSLRILAVGGEHRSAQVPDVPTMNEAGYPGFKAVSWYGLLAPAKTPRTVINVLAFELARAVKEPTIIERLRSASVDPLGTNPEEFSKMISADTLAWGQALKATGFAAN